MTDKESLAARMINNIYIFICSCGRIDEGYRTYLQNGTRPSRTGEVWYLSGRQARLDSATPVLDTGYASLRTRIGYACLRY